MQLLPMQWQVAQIVQTRYKMSQRTLDPVQELNNDRLPSSTSFTQKIVKSNI